MRSVRHRPGLGDDRRLGLQRQGWMTQTSCGKTKKHALGNTVEERPFEGRVRDRGTRPLGPVYRFGIARREL